MTLAIELSCSARPSLRTIMTASAVMVWMTKAREKPMVYLQLQTSAHCLESNALCVCDLERFGWGHVTEKSATVGELSNCTFMGSPPLS